MITKKLIFTLCLTSIALGALSLSACGRAGKPTPISGNCRAEEFPAPTS